MKTQIIPTESIIGLPIYNDDKIIVRQKMWDGYIKNWFCKPMTVQEYEQFLIDIKNNVTITLNLKEGK